MGNMIASQKNLEQVSLSNKGIQELPATIAQLRVCKVIIFIILFELLSLFLYFSFFFSFFVFSFFSFRCQ